MGVKWLLGMMAIAIVAMAAMAAGPDSSCAKKGKAIEEKMAKDLGLSADQQAKLKGLHAVMRDARKEHREKMKTLLDKSKEELLKPAPSKDALYGYAKESGELRRIMAEKEADHLLKVKAVLTPEQFKKLLERRPGGHGPGEHPGKWPRHKGQEGEGPHEKGPHGEMDE